MAPRTLALLASLLLASSSVFAAPSYTCKSFFVPVTISNVTTVVPPFPYPFPDGYAAVAFANAATYRDPPTITPNLTAVSGTFNISVDYCTPTKPGPKAQTIQLLTHGLGFDKKYWDFRLPSTPADTQYSYIAAALAAGYSTLSWDRLGCGLSPVVDPYTVLQAPVELAVLATLTGLVRAGAVPQVPAPKKVIHVGHSWGSLLSNALVAVKPELSDGVVLTGYSHIFSYEVFFIASANFHLASENQPGRFGGRSSGYLTWGDKYANQYSFLQYPYFDPAVLEYAEANKFPFTVGEFISQGALSYEAENFTGPVLYLAAQHDLIFCQSDCVGIMGPSSSVVTAFGKSSDLEVYIQPNVGHGINLHKNATGAYQVIQNWTAKHSF